VKDREKEIGQAYLPVLDSRRRRVPGIYLRGSVYYGLLKVEKANGKKVASRFRLLDAEDRPVADLNAAREALEILRHRRREDALPVRGRKLSFEKWVLQYLASRRFTLKKHFSQEEEKRHLEMWVDYLGGIQLEKIDTPLLKGFCEARLAGIKSQGKQYKPASVRTLLLDLIALRNSLKEAVDAGLIPALPRFPKYKPEPPPVRDLITPAEFELLLASCTALKEDGSPVSKNGKQLRDFLRVLAYSGGREQETLAIKWAHVDWKGKQLWIGAPPEFNASRIAIGKGGTSKNGEARAVDFNPQLEAVLEEMKGRRAPDSTWMFPSPQRGEKDLKAQSLRESMIRARKAAGLEQFAFHDLRHFFISYGVMAGIDFMTIARWVGHKDGGILIGKVYGHLADTHRQKMAAKMVIGISSVSPAPGEILSALP
jgi:integrase